ncbi:MAG TPA: hypothetical protein VLZ10_13855 [Thermodesulfobacteriota bacterium]|nr:hypothetical protein [Thermodesulfobacteriota bacterium]
MSSSCTAHSRNSTRFVIFFFTLCLISHLGQLRPGKLCLALSAAMAAEEQVSNAEQETVLAQATVEASPQEEPSSNPPAPTSGAKSMSSMTGTDEGDITSGVVATFSFQVDDFTGSAHLQYPIIVPPGRDGLQPSLALMYSSNSPNGWL